jgi:hypothetical protein
MFLQKDHRPGQHYQTITLVHLVGPLNADSRKSRKGQRIRKRNKYIVRIGEAWRPQCMQS